MLTAKSERIELETKFLHENPALLIPCCELLNDEWPRSLTARMRSIESSNENFPISILLVDGSQHSPVVGHAKLCKIPNVKDGCWVESVVIKKTERRKGYGKLLMERCEAVARSKGLAVAFLSTKDQQMFYKSLGYEECEPISLYGLSTLLQEKTLNSYSSNITISSSAMKEVGNSSNNASQQVNSPPPPPPMPPNASPVPLTKTFMKKVLK